jgi:hypothetical protein
MQLRRTLRAVHRRVVGAANSSRNVQRIIISYDEYKETMSTKRSEAINFIIQQTFIVVTTIELKKQTVSIKPIIILPSIAVGGRDFRAQITTPHLIPE